MTNVNHTLDPIRADNGTVGDNMPSVDVEVVQVQEEIIGDDGIENADKDAEVEEMRKPKPAARPYTPTRAEVYEHEVTHLPFRSWCKHCVHGRGVSSPCETGQEGEDRDNDQHGLLLHERRRG